MLGCSIKPSISSLLSSPLIKLNSRALSYSTDLGSLPASIKPDSCVNKPISTACWLNCCLITNFGGCFAPVYLLHQFNSDKKPSLILATHKDAWLCCAVLMFHFLLGLLFDCTVCLLVRSVALFDYLKLLPICRIFLEFVSQSYAYLTFLDSTKQGAFCYLSFGC